MADIAKKFGTVYGFNTVFAVNTAGTDYDFSKIKSGVTQVDGDSILYIKAAAADEQYGYYQGNTYVWAKGELKASRIQIIDLL